MNESNPPYRATSHFKDPSSLEARDHRYLWHPFTDMADWTEHDPLIIESGRGAKVVDTHGQEYFDGNSSLWVNIHGHRHPRIDAAIRDQLDRIAHPTLLGLSNPAAIELAERLVCISPPGLTKVFYSDSGSEAVEIALKIAFQHWNLQGETERTRYLTLANGYHGDTLGAVSVGGIDTFHGLFAPLLFPAHRTPSPAQAPSSARFTDPAAAIQQFMAVLQENAPTLAAVIMEPLIQAAGGMVLMPDGFLKQVEQACRKHNVLLIVDEVATGFGRTGKMFACEHEQVEPDLMTVAKGLTGGYLPLAATLASDRVFAPFYDKARGPVFYHGHSYTGNPLACAAALANLSLFDEEKTLEAVQPLIRQIRDRLGSFRRLEHVASTRQLGMMIGIEIKLEPRQQIPYLPGLKMGARVCHRARKLGMITRPLGDVVIFMPPLCSTAREIDEMLDILYEAIRQTTGEIPGGENV